MKPIKKEIPQQHQLFYLAVQSNEKKIILSHEDSPFKKNKSETESLTPNRSKTPAESSKSLLKRSDNGGSSTNLRTDFGSRLQVRQAKGFVSAS